MGIGSGLFLGGFQEGMSDRRESDRRDAKARLDEATQLAENKRADARLGVAQQNLDLETQKAKAAELGELNSKASKHIGDMIGTLQDTTKALRDAGKTQEEIEHATQEFAERIVTFGARFNQDPDLLAARVGSVVGRPSAPQTDLGKLEADRRAGYIDETTYREKLQGLSKGSGTTINVGGAGEKAFAGELNKNLAQEFVDRRKSAIDAVQSIKSNDEALGLLDKGIITGTGADYILQLGKGLQQIGVNLAPDAIANTESFVATRAQEVGRIIKLFGAGTGLSDADRDYATRAAAGQITLTEQSIRRILDINARASRSIIKTYNNDVQQLDPNVVPFDLRLPEMPSADAPTVRVHNGKRYIKRDGNWFRE